MQNIIDNLFTLSLEHRLTVIETLLGNYNDQNVVSHVQGLIETMTLQQGIAG